MFTTGQWVFALCFFIAFVILIIFSYRKDLALHKKYYRGSIWVLVGFLAFIGLLFVIKLILNE